MTRMRDVELDESVPAEVSPTPAPHRRHWWVVGVAGALVVGALTVQLVSAARERGAVARLAEVSGVLAPVDGSLPVAWASDSIDDTVWNVIRVGGAIVGPTVDDDGSQHLVAHDLSTGAVRWTTRLYGPDEARALAEAQRASSPAQCVPTTDTPDASLVACLVSDGFVAYGYEGSSTVPATETFVRVVDVADGHTVAEWPATGGSLSVLDGVAVVGSYDADDAVTFDGLDLMTGAPRWVVHLPEPDRVAGSGPADGPPSTYRVGDYVSYDALDGEIVMLDATGARAFAELPPPQVNRGEGAAFVDEPRSGRILYTVGQYSSSFTTTVVGGKGSEFSFAGRPAVPVVDDGSVPGLLLSTGTDLRSEGGDGSIVLHGRDIESGADLWEIHLDVSENDGVVVARGRVFVSTFTGVVALDGRTGAVLWSVDEPLGETFNGVMTDGRHLIVPVGTSDRASSTGVVALDPASGEQVWRTPVPASVDQVVAFGSVLLGLDVTRESGTVLHVVRLN